LKYACEYAIKITENALKYAIKFKIIGEENSESISKYALI